MPSPVASTSKPPGPLASSQGKASACDDEQVICLDTTADKSSQMISADYSRSPMLHSMRAKGKGKKKVHPTNAGNSPEKVSKDTMPNKRDCVFSLILPGTFSLHRQKRQSA